MISTLLLSASSTSSIVLTSTSIILSFAIFSFGFMIIGMLIPTRSKEDEEWRGWFVR